VKGALSKTHKLDRVQLCYHFSRKMSLPASVNLDATMGDGAVGTGATIPNETAENNTMGDGDGAVAVAVSNQSCFYI